MISLPRDLYVAVEPYEPTGLTDTWHTKITDAFMVGVRQAGPGPNYWSRDFDVGPDNLPTTAARGRGAAVIMRTISDLVPGGLQFHGWATVDFAGFEKVVEAVGSVHMCVDETFYSIHFWPNGEWAGNPLARGDIGYSGPTSGNYGDGYKYVEGWCGDMPPWMALDYARQRYGPAGGDYARQRHQQQLLKAIIRKVASPDTFTNLGTIQRLQETAGELLTLDLGGQPIEDWLITLKDLRADSITMVKTYAGKTRGALLRAGQPCEYGTENCLSYQRVEQDLIQLLQAVQTDNVFNFLLAHPDWVGEDAVDPNAVAATPTAT
jgi:hypothetical protein